MRFFPLPLLIALIIGVTPFQTAQLQPDLTLGLPSNLAWNAAGNLLAVSYDSGSIELLDTLGHRQALYHPTEGRIFALRWNPARANQLAFTNDVSQAVVLDTSIGQVIFVTAPYEHLGQIGWNRKGTQLAVSGENGMGPVGENELSFWDVSTGELMKTMEHQIEGFQFALNPQHGELLAIMNGGDLTIWNIDTDEKKLVLIDPDRLYQDFVWSPDGGSFAVVYVDVSYQSGFTSALEVRDRSLGQTQYRVTSMNNIGDVSWGQDDSLVFNDGGRLRVMSLALKNQLAQLVPDGFFGPFAWSVNGQLAVIERRQVGRQWIVSVRVTTPVEGLSNPMPTPTVTSTPA